MNKEIIDSFKVDRSVIESVTEQESKEVERREQEYRGSRPVPNVKDHTVIIIDDGLATGATMLAAVAALRTQHPTRIVVAVPAAAPQAIKLVQPRVDDAVYVIAPEEFEGVGKWYEDFSQTTDEEVQQLLAVSNLRFHP